MQNFFYEEFQIDELFNITSCLLTPTKMLVSLIVILCVVSCASAFNMPSSFVVQRNVRVGLKMEYIPEGLSKAQWAAIKKKVCT